MKSDNWEEPCEPNDDDVLGLDPREDERQYAELFAYACEPDTNIQRLVPVRIYLSNTTDEETYDAVDAVHELCAALDMEIHIEFPGQRGSFFKRLIARTFGVMTHQEVTERLKKAERALELHVLEKPQSDVDGSRLQGTAELLKAIGDNDAVIQIGSILLVKHCCHDCPGRMFVRTLTQAELIFIEKNQQYLRRPHEILDALNAISKQDDNSIQAASAEESPGSD